MGVAVVVGGAFLAWTSVRGALHIGFLIMIAAVWLTDWFLERTTPGFELRTVGSNPDAAKYAGMNVRLNVVLALALGGALAGLAGAIEVSGVQRNMQPLFFGGVGFDAIAVALLARSNPRAMIPAGLLWGALLSGAGLMQTRANISIDLVKIIQALIIMFIAADAIIRYLWRVPEATEEEKQATLFASKGWGG
jgi:simple sugar transport system permease protein